VITYLNCVNVNSSLLPSDSNCTSNNELGTFLSIGVIFFVNKAEDCYKFLNGVY